MKQVHFFLFVFFLTCIFSCRKPIDFNSELVGKWHSPVPDDYRNINIDENGKGTYVFGANSFDAVPSRTVRADENSFRIGPSKFEIVTHPIPFDSATDWVGEVRSAFAPNYLPTKKMEIRKGRDTRWYYKRR
ncbi:hypothetical protein BH11BAC7_BH11BAC7_18870 [soil metagenome]